jgi:transketolase
LEDVGVMRIQPGLTVIAPADHEQARTAFLATWNLPGPVYYRLGKDDKTVVPALGGRFELGRIQLIREGADVVIVVMGSIANEVASAGVALADHGVSCAVAVVSTLSPAPVDDLSALLARFPVALAVEAHYVVGGLGSLISELVAEQGLRCRVVRCGVRSAVSGISGSQDYLYRMHRLSKSALVATALQEMQGQRATR